MSRNDQSLRLRQGRGWLLAAILVLVVPALHAAQTSSPSNTLVSGFNTGGGSSTSPSFKLDGCLDEGLGGASSSASFSLVSGCGAVLSAVVLAIPSADLAITKTPSAPPYGAGMPITYTITVSNAGPDPAALVTVADNIPPGTTFTSATPSQGSCSGTSSVTCSLGTIGTGASATITLVLTLPSTPGPVVNTASVTSSTADPNLLTNSSTSTVTVIPAAAIPAVSQLALLLLLASLALLGAIRLHR